MIFAFGQVQRDGEVHLCNYIPIFISVIQAADSEDDIITIQGNYQNDAGSFDSEIYGGIIFPPDFDYGPNSAVPNLSYTVRFGVEYTQTETNVLFPIFQLSGPGFWGKLNIF